METMTVSDAIAVVKSRNGIPREDDWDLMEAADVLCGAMEDSIERENERIGEWGSDFR